MRTKDEVTANYDRNQQVRKRVRLSHRDAIDWMAIIDADLEDYQPGKPVRSIMPEKMWPETHVIALFISIYQENGWKVETFDELGAYCLMFS